MKRVALFLFLSMMVSGCGSSLAPLDAVVTGPADATVTVNPPGGGTQFFRPLDFQVANKAGIALPDIEIEFLANFSAGTATLTDLNRNPLDPNNPTYFKTKTDDRGLARVAFLMALPNCDPANDLTVTGGVTATVGITSKVWTATFTVKKC